MNTKRFLICLIAAFVTISATDFVIHQIILKPDYMATMSLWRTEATMQEHMSWIFIGEFIVALGMTMLWLRGFAEKATMNCVFGFGLSAGMLLSAYAATFYAVMPIPGLLCVKWALYGLLQTMLTTTVLYMLSRPKAA